MSFIEALFLGLVQGLTEFLPVSSSGHLTIGKEFLNITTDNLAFEVVVHAATVLSTIVVFRREIWSLISGFFKFKYNSETSYILKIGVSMIPVFIVGIFFKDFVTSIFASGLLVVGVSLLITSMLLFLTNSIKKNFRRRSNIFKSIYYRNSPSFCSPSRNISLWCYHLCGIVGGCR